VKTRGRLARGFALLLLAAPACAPKPADTGAAHPDQAPVPVTVAPVSPQTLRRTVSVTGTLDAFKDVTLGPEVDGRVVRVAKDVGAAVLPGEVLLELDPRDFETDVAIARATLQSELDRLELADLPAAGADPAAVVEGVPAVAKARASLEEASRKVEQQQRLINAGSGSKEDHAVAAAERKVAEAGLRQVKAETLAALANCRRLAANVEKAEKRLRDAVLRAPVPEEWPAWAAVLGPAAAPVRYTVAARMVWEGEMVRAMPEKNAFRLVMDQVLKLRAAVPEKHAPEVKVGQAVEVRVDAYPDRVFAGRVARVAPTVDTLNRTFLVEVELPNRDPAARLKAGGFAKAEILTRTETGVVTVPPGAVVAFAGVTKVFLADGDRAKAVEVKLGQREKDWVEVLGPVPPGARIITSGFSQLVDGSPIRVRQ
jgi:multidrug efflux pump subunit AcrA (membrane-fusion protein)